MSTPGKNWSDSFAEWGKVIEVLISDLIIHKLNHIQPTFFTYLKYIIRESDALNFKYCQAETARFTILILYS